MPPASANRSSCANESACVAAGPGAGVLHGGANLEAPGVTVQDDVDIADGEGRIREAEAEGVGRRLAVPVQQSLAVPPVVGHRRGVLVEWWEVRLVAGDGE